MGYDGLPVYGKVVGFTLASIFVIIVLSMEIKYYAKDGKYYTGPTFGRLPREKPDGPDDAAESTEPKYAFESQHEQKISTEGSQIGKTLNEVCPTG